MIWLGLLCLALAVALYFWNSSAEAQLKAVLADSLRFSNQWQESSLRLTNQEMAGAVFQASLSNRVDELISISNRLVKVRANLEKSDAAANAALSKNQSRGQRISDLETERDELARRMEELNTSFTSQKLDLAETSQKLQASEGDRAWLLKELKRLQAAQDQLSEAFNDPRSVREQLVRLKKEESAQLRLVKEPKSNLKLQLQQDGSVKLGSPLANASAGP